jgi:hypothetical protein
MDKTPLEMLAYHRSQVDRWTMQLIIDELNGFMPKLTDAVEQAEKALQEAEDALAKPAGVIAGLDEQIAEAEKERAHWAQDLESPSIGTRVPARGWVMELDAELVSLRQKKEFAESGLQPLYDVRNKCSNDLELAKGARMGLACAMLTPYAGFAQGTQAYVGHRQPYINHVILSGDHDDPEWDTAVAELAELCLLAGFTKDDMPDRAQDYRKFWDDIKNEHAPEPAPSGREVAESIHSAFEVNMQNKWLEESPSVMERRDIPRNDRVPSYMRTPDISDTARLLG